MNDRDDDRENNLKGIDNEEEKTISSFLEAMSDKIHTTLSKS